MSVKAWTEVSRRDVRTFEKEAPTEQKYKSEGWFTSYRETVSTEKGVWGFVLIIEWKEMGLKYSEE